MCSWASEWPVCFSLLSSQAAGLWDLEHFLCQVQLSKSLLSLFISLFALYGVQDQEKVMKQSCLIYSDKEYGEKNPLESTKFRTMLNQSAMKKLVRAALPPREPDTAIFLSLSLL